MSQIFFSKQGPEETQSRLSALGQLGGVVTLWLKGSKDKKDFKVSKFDKDRVEIVLDSKEHLFKPGSTILCSFDLRGMSFFSEVVFQISVGGHDVLQFKNTLFKSERRNSYRLLTFPLYEVWAEFDIGEVYEGGKVIDLKTKSSQTGIFKNFLQLVDNISGDESENLKIRIQDISTTGMALHIGELESKFFTKDISFKNVSIRFTDSVIKIPEAVIVYVVDMISSDRNMKKYKIGVNFPNLPASIDEQIGKKINELLRQNEFNKDFENFLK